MVIPGRIENGVVVLKNGTSLPDGTEVSVLVPAALIGLADVMTEEHRTKLLEALDRIAALPLEGPDDGFSGADHDRILYGKP